jgi:VIT1/CCC1 family predicted Fe2+/Mn2+ transporter
MSFFKKYNGTTNLRLARLETLIWTLIYGGLLTLIVGAFMGRSEEGSGAGVMLLGAIVAVVGVVLIYVRSRLREED